MSARSDFLTAVTAVVEAIADWTEHKGAVTEQGLPATAVRGAGNKFVVTMPGAAAVGDRGRNHQRVTETVTVGFLVEIKQSDRPASLSTALQAEDALLAAMMGSGVVDGWDIAWEGTERADVGEGAYFGVRVTFAATSTIPVGT